MNVNVHKVPLTRARMRLEEDERAKLSLGPPHAREEDVHG
jgi:hypothetical protein